LSSSSPPSITTSRVQNNRETHLRIHHARSCLDLLVKLRQQIHSQEF
jgi:hypothetical protein